MNPQIAFSVIYKQFCLHRNSLMKLEYDINASAAATVYVQLHDFPSSADLALGLTVPAVGSVPIKSWPVPAGATDNYKEFKNGELTFVNGCFAVVSTTQATLTIGTGNNKFDSVAAELWEFDVTGSTTVNDQGVLIEAVWSAANGATHNYKLLRLSATNLEAGVRYLQLFGYDGSIADGTYCLEEWTLAATGDSGGLDTIGKSFGTGVNGAPFGRIVMQEDSSLVFHNGCTLALSTTPKILTAAIGSGMNIYAEYK